MKKFFKALALSLAFAVIISAMPAKAGAVGYRIPEGLPQKYIDWLGGEESFRQSKVSASIDTLGEVNADKRVKGGT